MQKSLLLIAAGMMGLVSSMSMAAGSDQLVVFAKQVDRGSMSVGNKSFYTHSFDITLSNLNQEDVDLSKLCLQAYQPDGKAFKLDTVDQALVSGTLKSKAIVKGIAVFSAEDESVYRASMVKISDKCQ